MTKTPSKISINGYATPTPTSFLMRKWGAPGKLTKNCSSILNPEWSKRMRTRSVGPFKVTGHFLAISLLTKKLNELKADNPSLYKKLGTAGMLCCRATRVNPKVYSNHSLGLAIDFTIAGVLDAPGDGLTQPELIVLYQYLKPQSKNDDGFFWGAEFGVEDSMHFEVSGETVMRWVRGGLF